MRNMDTMNHSIPPTYALSPLFPHLLFVRLRLLNAYSSVFVLQIRYRQELHRSRLKNAKPTIDRTEPKGFGKVS